MKPPRRLSRPLSLLLAALALGGASLLLMGTGCEDSTVAPRSDGRNVTVTEGQDAVLATGDRIHFEKVTADSRCPKGLECFWEGEASAAFTMRASTRFGTPFTLTLQGALVAADTLQSMQRFQTIQVGRYHLTLLQLDPYPRAGRNPLLVQSTALIRVEY